MVVNLSDFKRGLDNCVEDKASMAGSREGYVLAPGAKASEYHLPENTSCVHDLSIWLVTLGNRMLGLANVTLPTCLSVACSAQPLEKQVSSLGALLEPPVSLESQVNSVAKPAFYLNQDNPGYSNLKAQLLHHALCAAASVSSPEVATSADC